MFLRLFGSLLTLFVWSPSGAWAQQASLQDCQTATRLWQEADVIQDLFRKNWRPIKEKGLPAIGPLQDAVKADLAACQNGTAVVSGCADYSRTWKAETGGVAGRGGSREFGTHPQTCEITDEDGNLVTEADAPAGGVARARFLRGFRHEQYHQGNCRALNKDGNFVPGGLDSDYKIVMNDPETHAMEEVYAYDISKDILEDYLEKNCFDPELEMDVEPLKGKCGEAGDGEASIDDKKGGSTYRMRSDSDWLAVPDFPLQTDDQGKTSMTVSGACSCCGRETRRAWVRAYSGPEQSVMVGKTVATLRCTAKPECADAEGDPHMRSYDGLSFDFQAVGEFVLARAEDFEVQARFSPSAGNPRASSNTAAAVRLGPNRITLYPGESPRLFINGKQWVLDPEDEIDLGGGATVRWEADRFRLDLDGRYVAELRMRKNYIAGVHIGAPRGGPLVGLLGNHDGSLDNDLITADGVTLTEPVAFEDLYGDFAAGWRVTPETTLFDYFEDETWKTFVDLNKPVEPTTTASLDPDVRRRAEEVCRKHAVEGDLAFENCVYDVGITGDEGYAEDAAEQAAIERPGKRLNTGEEPEPAAGGAISFAAPREAIASFDVEIQISGEVIRGDQIRFAPEGSDIEGKARAPYASRGLNPGNQETKLVAPATPGAYELRYIRGRGRSASILFRQDFRVHTPRARIEAPDFAQAGGMLEARIVGDISPNSAVDVVPVGTPDKILGRHGVPRPDGSVVVRRLLEEPGEYEIRYSSTPYRVIYARKKLILR